MLAGWGVDSDHTDDTLLVVNELLANAVEHARTPLILTVSCTGTALRVEVRDESVAEPRLQPVDLRAARGRGLQFVRRCSHASLELDRGRVRQDRVGRDGACRCTVWRSAKCATIGVLRASSRCGSVRSPFLANGYTVLSLYPMLPGGGMELRAIM